VSKTVPKRSGKTRLLVAGRGAKGQVEWYTNCLTSHLSSLIMHRLGFPRSSASYAEVQCANVFAGVVRRLRLSYTNDPYLPARPVRLGHAA
jgi:hypothetical protein